MAAITPQILLDSTGRENGPDFLLKVDVPAFLANSVINANSNITEVLNVIAYLCNAANRTDAQAMLGDQSVDPAQHGLHVAGTGQYQTANTGDGASADSLWLVDAGGAATTQMIDLNTLQIPANYAANHIPVGILARQAPAGAGLLGATYPTPNDLVIGIANAAGPIAADTLPHFSNAIKQMIKILENTRNIFGPKGWTALFSKVKGGGAGAGKNNAAKRTHRQHRRKYSSKHY
jgi:hypothetical protein